MNPGDQIGRWTVGANAGTSRYRVRCSCGADRTLHANRIREGAFARCACWTSDMRRRSATRHGESVNAGNTTEYRTWRNIRARFLQPKCPAYADYGARGITLCERWLSFANFLEDMGRRPAPGMTIDRIDNDGSYGPDNCRWATKSEQACNRRTTRKLTIGGETKALAEWARAAGINVHAIMHRLRRGWPPERAVTAPLRMQQPRAQETR